MNSLYLYHKNQIDKYSITERFNVWFHIFLFKNDYLMNFEYLLDKNNIRCLIQLWWKLHNAIIVKSLSISK